MSIFSCTNQEFPWRSPMGYFYTRQFCNIPEAVLLHGRISLSSVGTGSYTIVQGSDWISSVTTGAVGQIVLTLSQPWTDLCGSMISISSAGFVPYVSTNSISNATTPTVTIICDKFVASISTLTDAISTSTYPTNSTIDINLLIDSTGQIVVKS